MRLAYYTTQNPGHSGNGDRAEAAARGRLGRRPPRGRTVGGELGGGLRDQCASRTDAPLAVAEWAARQLGYEPEHHDDHVQLRNCPFDELADSHRDLICQMNQALMAGLLPALGTDGVSAEPIQRRPGVSCWVRITASG
jgi:predicted ArsR family transcriptional regulator